MKITICIGSSCHLKGSRKVVEELQRLIDEEDSTDVTCQFCDVIYHFDRKDLEELKKAQKN